MMTCAFVMALLYVLWWFVFCARMPRLVSQGTISVLIGCHSPIHGLLVVIAWRKLYGKFPKLWQIACIFLHDVGHVGLDYLDNYDEKKQHWRGGAYIAYWLFGEKGYELVAGHSSHSWFPPNRLYYADRYSWTLAPYWWLYWNSLVEPQLNCGMSIKAAIKTFRDRVRENVESGRYEATHNFFLERNSIRGID